MGLGPTLLIHLTAKGEVRLRQSAQLGGGRTIAFLVALPLTPRAQHIFEVTLQDGRQVVVGVELVFVADARQVDGHDPPYPRLPTRTAAT